MKKVLLNCDFDIDDQIANIKDEIQKNTKKIFQLTKCKNYSNALSIYIDSKLEYKNALNAPTKISFTNESTKINDIIKAINWDIKYLGAKLSDLESIKLSD